MNIPATLPIQAWRNADLRVEVVLTDAATGLPIDYTGAVASAQVRLYGGADGSPLVDLAFTNVAAVDGLYVVDSAGGVFDIIITKATLAAFPVADTSDPAKPLLLSWDLRMALVGDDTQLLLAGTFTLNTGVVR